MRRVRNEHSAPRISAICVVGPNGEQTGELPVRTRRRLEREGRHAGYLDERALAELRVTGTFTTFEKELVAEAAADGAAVASPLV